jgi:hypothetical protein
MPAFHILDQNLKALGIDTSQHGFYGQKAFLKQQAKDPAFINTYARWVRLRPRSPSYDAYVRHMVPTLSEIIVEAFRADNCHGWCVAASSMMSRMLDRLGIWNYGVLGSTSFDVPSQDISCGFYRQDFEDFPGVVLGHAWLVAPPFEIIDPTVVLQNWGGDPVVDFLPPYVATEDVREFEHKVLDVVSWRLWEHYSTMEGAVDAQLHWRLEPHLRDLAKTIPAMATQAGPLEMRYVPSRIHLSLEPLELMTTDGAWGRTGAQIWETEVMATLGWDQDAAS